MVLRAFVLVVAAIAPAFAINLQLSQADIERALTIARDRDKERARFHEPYITRLDGPFVEQIEIVTQFRRVVMTAEERILRGDRAFAYSSRIAQETAKTWDHRVSVVVRIRFHPLNNYVTVPDIGVTVDGPNAQAALVGVLKEPVYGFAEPGQAASLAGAVAEGVFDATVIGQTQRTVTVTLAGKPIAAVRLDFAAVE